MTWVAWACIAAYGKYALIKIGDQPPLGVDHQDKASFGKFLIITGTFTIQYFSLMIVYGKRWNTWWSLANGYISVNSHLKFLLITFKMLWISYLLVTLAQVPINLIIIVDSCIFGGTLVACSLSMHQLEVLMRVHVMMSQLHRKGSSNHKQLSIAALGFCFQLWKVIII